MLYILMFLNNINNKGVAKYCITKMQPMVMMELIFSIYIHGHTKWLFSETYSEVMDTFVVLADAMIEACLRNNGTGTSSSSVPTHEQTLVHDQSLNIYQRQFDFHPELSTSPFVFFLHPQNVETSVAGADEARRDLLTTNVNYADIDECTSQDDLLLTHPLHRHLFP
jgi:hypothetical protein